MPSSVSIFIGNEPKHKETQKNRNFCNKSDSFISDRDFVATHQSDQVTGSRWNLPLFVYSNIKMIFLQASALAATCTGEGDMLKMGCCKFYDALSRSRHISCRKSHFKVFCFAWFAIFPHYIVVRVARVRSSNMRTNFRYGRWERHNLVFCSSFACCWLLSV